MPVNGACRERGCVAGENCLHTSSEMFTRRRSCRRMRSTAPKRAVTARYPRQPPVKPSTAIRLIH